MGPWTTTPTGNPTIAEVAAGHRIRLTLTTSDTPHLLPSPGQAANLIGGVYAIQRTKAAPSYLQVPLAEPGAFPRCSICG